MATASYHGSNVSSTEIQCEKFGSAGRVAGKAQSKSRRAASELLRLIGRYDVLAGAEAEAAVTGWHLRMHEDAKAVRRLREGDCTDRGSASLLVVMHITVKARRETYLIIVIASCILAARNGFKSST